MTKLTVNRREALAGLSAASVIALLGGCAQSGAAPVLPASGPMPATDAQASVLLDAVADNLLRLSPESATSLSCGNS